jgi:hypothetical protein
VHPAPIPPLLSFCLAESNTHPGNVWFRERVEERKAEYRASNNATKTRIAQEVVRQVRIRQPPGRFLVRNPDSGLWNDVGAAEAHKKAKQALREPPRGGPPREIVAHDDMAAPANLLVAVRDHVKR